MTNLEDFIQNMTIEDLRKHRGYEFCIDYDLSDNINYWFDDSGTYICFDHFEITADMDRYDFEWEVEKIIKDINELKEIQQNLTVTTEDYRERTLDLINDELKICGFKTIPIQKYNDENDVIKTIKVINTDNPNLEDFLEYFSIQHELDISLVREKDGTYSTWDDYTGVGKVIDVIDVPMKQILSTDSIVYKPSLSNCQKIKDKFSHNDKCCNNELERWG